MHKSELLKESEIINTFHVFLSQYCTCNNYNSNYGNLECSWNGRNKNNIRVSNGVYFCKLSIDKNNIWEKLMVINTQKGDY